MITLANIQEASLQDIFTQVAIHLLTQKKASGREDSRRCAYRGDEGTKCAVGCLIADDEYNPEMDGKASTSVDALIMQNLFPKLSKDKLSLLGKLQHIHDSRLVSNWKSELESIAALNDLDFPYDKI